MNRQKLDDNSGTSGRGQTTIFETAIDVTAQQIRETDHVFQDWENGPFSHLSRLAIPHPTASGDFRFSASGQYFNNLLSAKAYFDSLTGVSGRNLEQDPIVVDLVTSGRLEFAGGREKHIVTPGQICIRDAKASWEFSCAPATRVRIVTIPRHAIISRVDSAKALDQAHIEDAKSPKGRFFVHFLEALEKSSDDLDISVDAQNLALDSCATLVAGMLSESFSARLNYHQQTIVRAAKRAIDKNLDKHDLSPAMIAQILGISPRTLHRSFSASGDSIMAFARRRRLQKAHYDLTKSGNTANISEIAARWHFSDASHFIRTFKSVYGAPPAVYARNNIS